MGRNFSEKKTEGGRDVDGGIILKLNTYQAQHGEQMLEHSKSDILHSLSPPLWARW